MDQILPPELNDLEFEALRQLAAHPITHHIPSRIQSRLKDIGYAKEVLGGIVLTKDGLQRISEANDTSIHQVPGSPADFLESRRVHARASVRRPS